MEAQTWVAVAVYSALISVNYRGRLFWAALACPWVSAVLHVHGFVSNEVFLFTGGFALGISCADWLSTAREDKTRRRCEEHWAEVQHRMNNHVARETSKTAILRQMLREAGVSARSIREQLGTLADTAVVRIETRPPLCEP